MTGTLYIVTSFFMSPSAISLATFTSALAKGRSITDHPSSLPIQSPSMITPLYFYALYAHLACSYPSHI
ncbi:hypothetical protein F5H01DRAFT_329094 [Linnemannia elongata]|nr:hypothetical protein F5H01DRAFT_329094 [Linnemannia elongata]